VEDCSIEEKLDFGSLRLEVGGVLRELRKKIELSK
jgi:hypothetical protein